jgi:hypothetical protein
MLSKMPVLVQIIVKSRLISCAANFVGNVDKVTR